MIHSWNRLLVCWNYLFLLHDDDQWWVGLTELVTGYLVIFIIKLHVSMVYSWFWLQTLKNIYQSVSTWKTKLERPATSRSVCGTILYELRLSVNAWIRTCKAGLVQVLIGLVKHIRCSDFEMSLTPIIPWHYSQPHNPHWAACLSTPHWRKKTTFVSKHLTTRFRQVYSKGEGKWYWAAYWVLDIYLFRLNVVGVVWSFATLQFSSCSADRLHFSEA